MISCAPCEQIKPNNTVGKMKPAVPMTRGNNVNYGARGTGYILVGGGISEKS